MNTSNLLATHVTVICACVLLGLPATSSAQQTAATAGRPPANGGFDTVIADGLLTRNGEPIEATLENVVDLLRDRHPEANIVLAPDVPPVLIENLKIRATDLPMELEALRIASGERFMWSPASGSIMTDPATGLPFMHDPVTGLPVDLPARDRDQLLYVLRAAPAAAAQLRVEAFSLDGYFASLPKADDPGQKEGLIREKIGELETMVDETAAIYHEISKDVYGRGPSYKQTLNLRFHRGANLVILIGDPESVEVAAKVIGALPHVQPSGGGMGFGGFDGAFGARGAGGGRTSGYGMDPFAAPMRNPYGGAGGGGYGGTLQGRSADEPPR